MRSNVGLLEFSAERGLYFVVLPGNSQVWNSIATPANWVSFLWYFSGPRSSISNHRGVHLWALLMVFHVIEGNQCSQTWLLFNSTLLQPLFFRPFNHLPLDRRVKRVEEKGLTSLDSFLHQYLRASISNFFFSLIFLCRLTKPLSVTTNSNQPTIYQQQPTLSLGNLAFTCPPKLSQNFKRTT